MKCHYPGEYMAALLSSVLDNGQKIAEYTAECRERGLSLLPPDVNESQAGFSVSGRNIRFGLAAIKGIGRNAVSQLVSERKSGGPFRSFEDFLRRMNGKDFNRRAVENLILSGGFDSFGYKRRALVTVAGSMIDSIARETRDNLSGQMDLFGGWEDDSESIVQDSIPIPDVEEYSPRERMAKEKEMTGLYLSGHPMDEYRQAVRRAGAVPAAAIINAFSDGDENDGSSPAFHDNQNVIVAGVINSHRTRTTKNSSLMCYVQLEDDSGSIELIVFQKALDACGSYIVDNAAVLVRGRISVRDEKEAQIMVESLRPLSDLNDPAVRQEDGSSVLADSKNHPLSPPCQKKLYVRLSSEESPEFRRISLILTMFPGNDSMIIWCEKEQKRLGTRCLLHEGLLLELKERLGEENVVLKS
jgi:DNA polymerase-3 subunit alpha